METSNTMNPRWSRSSSLAVFWSLVLILIVNPVTSHTTAQEFVTFPSAEVAFICGPQLRSGSNLNPFFWFDETATTKGPSVAAELPAIGPRDLTGTVSVSNNSYVVYGSGTRFLNEVDPQGPAPYYDGWLRIRDGAVVREVKVALVQSNTQLILTTAWGFSSVNSTTADTYHHVTSQSEWNSDHYQRGMYYDTPLVQYINYYRTGNPVFLQHARRLADSWWGSKHVDFGTLFQGPNHPNPYTQAAAGLMLRALDGKPEYWDYLYRHGRATFDHWVKIRKTDQTLYYDIRDDGYAQLYAVMLARVLPDQYPLYGNGTLMPSTGLATNGAQKRAELLADAEDLAVCFFGRLQKTDGSWRWDVDESSTDPNKQHRNVEQPFMIGLYLESVVLLHQLTTNPTVKANLVNQLTRALLHLYNDTYERNVVPGYSPDKWRAVVYYWGGGTVADPDLYSPPSPRPQPCGRSLCGDNSVTVARQLNSTIHHAFGFAYAITGNTQYRIMGDEMFGASFGDTTDTIRNLTADAGAKEYDQAYRASGKYLAWRLSGSLQFSTANFSKPESGPSTNIWVNRTGDTSGPATVEFRTGNNAYVPCNAINGVASQNCDFIISSGTLTFAPGQTSKSFPIILIDDLYADGNETISLSLSNPTGAVLGSQSTATLTILDNDTVTPSTNPLDDAGFFVRQHYYDFLGRLPDEGGLNYWANEITQCGSNTACINERRVAVSNAFFYEQEYQQTASFAFLLYRASFGNNQPFPNPDQTNVTEAQKLPSYVTFVRDRVQVVGGANLASSQLALANAFVQRSEFVAKYPPSLTTGAQFVSAVLATIQSASGVDLSSQTNTLINHFNNGGRGLVMFHLANDYWNGCGHLPGNPPAPCVPAGFGTAVDNRAFIDAEYNRSFVYSQYSGYLRRDGDIGGFLFWLNQVSTAPPRNVAKQRAMVCAFITGDEYQRRFSSVVTRTNGECPP